MSQNDNENKVAEETSKLLENKLQAMKEKIARGEQLTYEDRIKVLVLADSPQVVTGFGNVCREVLASLQATGFYEFEVVGINYDGRPHDLPYKIWPAVNALIPDSAYRDVYGKQKYLDLLGSGRFDITWIIQDTFIIDELGPFIQQTNENLPEDKRFAWIFYFPVDATLKKRWIDHSALISDFPVVYTKYGYDETMKLYSVGEDTKLEEKDQEEYKMQGELLEGKLNVIYHGCNLTDFYKIDDKEKVEELRSNFWGDKKDKFIFINVNRNQPRKDYFRTLEAFKILLDRRRAKGKDDVYLYCHCNIHDTGLNLIDMSKQLQLVDGEEFAFPDPKMFGPSSGFPIKTVNELYNASDCLISTTLGEGWGLSLTEGMAVQIPVIAPDNTSIPEILGKTNSGGAERGFIAKTKGTFVQHDDNSRVRPITDPESMADMMEYVMEHKEEVKAITDRAHKWVHELEWTGQLVGAKWAMVFENAYAFALAKRAIAVDKMLADHNRKSKLGRNDICPVCQVKFKNCRHYVVQETE